MGHSSNTAIKLDYDFRNKRVRCNYDSEQVIVDGEKVTVHRVYARVHGARYMLKKQFKSKEKAFNVFSAVKNAGEITLSLWEMRPTMSEIRNIQVYASMLSKILEIKLPDLEYKGPEKKEEDIAF